MPTVCKNCGQELLENIKFCTNCGEPVVQESICSSCGQKVKPGAKFCTECGALLDQSEAAAESSQPPKLMEAPAVVEPIPIAEQPAPVSTPPTAQNQSQPQETVVPSTQGPTLSWQYRTVRLFNFLKFEVTLQENSLRISKCTNTSLFGDFEEISSEDIKYCDIVSTEVKPKTSTWLLVEMAIIAIFLLAVTFASFSEGDMIIILVWLVFALTIGISCLILRFDVRHKRLTMTMGDGTKKILEAENKDESALLEIQRTIECIRN